MAAPKHALGGKNHPNYKTGAWVGAKRKVRTKTPRTNATQLCRQWVTAHVKIGAEFESATLKDALEHLCERRSLGSGLLVLRRQGMIRALESDSHYTRNIRLK